MTGAPEPAQRARLVDPQALRHITRRLQRAEQAPWLHVEAGRRMAERLVIVRQQPRQVIDWWSFNGGSLAALQAAYPRANVMAVEGDDGPRALRPGKVPAPVTRVT